ncbi:MAG: hypothetical protein EBZ67_16450, partial [Chitinophagia bacterium]|nr:hypothetical protein [Chitinophagia bacterium]
WLGTAIESPNSPSTVVRPTTNQRYKVIQTHRTTGCTGSAEVLVSVTQAGFAVDTTPTRQLVICQGDSVVLPLKITPSTGNYQYAWTPSPSLSNAFAKNPAARPTATTTYTGIVTNLANNCQTSVSIPVRVIPIQDCAGDEYGDAPLSYENNGDPAKHGIIPTLRIGNYIDADNGANNATAGGIASGDDSNQYPDEDGVSALADIQYSENAYELVINNVLNDTVSVAYLVAWADFDRNGTFDADERSDILSVPRDSTPRVLGLSWQGFNPTRSLTPGRTYLRVRLTSDISGNWLQNPSPYGYRADGEVEDYSFNIVRFFPFPDFGVTDKNVPLSGDLGINDQGRSAGVAYLAATPGQNNPSSAALTVNQDGTYSFPGASPGVYTFRVPAFNGVDTAFFPVTISVLDPDTD